MLNLLMLGYMYFLWRVVNAGIIACGKPMSISDDEEYGNIYRKIEIKREERIKNGYDE